MRYISIHDAEPGMKLAYDLYDNSGRVLVSCNVRLNTNHIRRLREYNYSGIYVDDPLSEGIEIPNSIPPVLRNEIAEALREKDINNCIRLSGQIVDELIAQKELTLDFADLRSADDWTYTHSINVAICACTVGIAMNMGMGDLYNLCMSALFHDFGKMDIPKEVLNKPERLTADEYRLVKTHPIKSYDYIKDRTDISAQVKVAVLFHHENVDGSGYPKGLAGENQSLLTKILHTVDVYDALVSRRPYKEPYSPFEASEYLMGGAGIQFDLGVVGTFIRRIPIYPKGSEVILSDGRRGIIYDNLGVHSRRPVVRLYDRTSIDLNAPQNQDISVQLADQHYATNIFESEQKRLKMVQDSIKYRIGILDDMVTNLNALRDILEGDYDISLFKKGIQCIKYYKTNPLPDLLILDIDMPDMSGIDMAKTVRWMPGGDELPILFVTSLADINTVLACKRLRAAGYIVRPYNDIYIREEVRRIIRSSKNLQ